MVCSSCSVAAWMAGQSQGSKGLGKTSTGLSGHLGKGGAGRRVQKRLSLTKK